MTTKKNAMHSLWGSKARADAAARVKAVLSIRRHEMMDSYYSYELETAIIQELLDAVKPLKAPKETK